MLATTIEQSKKLLSLGISPDTADMYWEYFNKYETEYGDWEGYNDIPRAEPYYTYSRTDREWENDKADIPAWSLTALLKLVGGSFKLFHTENGFYFVPYHKYVTKTYEEPIDAAMEMVEWLIKEEIVK